MKNVKPLITGESAIRLFLLLGCSIFAAESLSHLVTHAQQPNLQWVDALLDSTLLLVLLFPSTYFFVFRPLSTHIAELKTAEAKIQRINNLYIALSHCNQAIVRCTNEEDLFSHICRAAVQFGGMKMAWVGLTDPDTHMVRPVASFGVGIEYLQDIEISLETDSSFGHGPTGTSIREDRPFWCQDFQNDPLTAPWHERGERVGWAATASLPLHRSGVVIGGFALYAGEVNAFDTAERDLLVEMATDIDFALDNFTREAARKQAEEAFQNESKKIEILLNTVNDGIHVIDIEGNVEQVNDAFCRMLGYSKEKLLSMNVAQFDARWPEKELKAVLASLMQFNKHQVFETRHYRRDGTVIDVEVSTNTVEIDGNPLIYASARDITERKLAEEKLHEISRRFHLATSSAQAGVWDWILQTNEMIWDDRMLELYGLTRENFSGGFEAWKQGLHPDDYSTAVEECQAALRGERDFDTEFRGLRPDGTVIHIKANGLVLRDEEGKPLRMIGLNIDISKHKRAEKSLKDLSTHLQTVREEEKANIAREIHDELGGIMTALKIDLYWLGLKLPSSKKTATLIDRIDSMSQLLDTAVASTRRIITELRPTMLDDLGLFAAIKWQTMEFQKRTDIECLVNCAEDKGNLDKNSSIVLFRILQEALTNVARHSGATLVEVDYCHDEDAVSLRVSDNGCGLDEKGNVDSNHFGIRGMSERAISLGGTINIESYPNKGLAVTAILPMHDERLKGSK